MSSSDVCKSYVSFRRKFNSCGNKVLKRLRKYWKYSVLPGILWFVITYYHRQSMPISLNNEQAITNTSVHPTLQSMKLKLTFQDKILNNKHFKKMQIRNKSLRNDDFIEFLNVSSVKLKDNLLHFHKFSYTINERDICKHKEILVLSMFHSAPQNENERNQIRKTSAAAKNIGNQNLATVFLLAQTINASLQMSILNESRRHRDIIQGQFIDHYRNLTYKNIMGLDWMLKFCKNAKFVLKADDDVLVNPYHLSAFIGYKLKMDLINHFLYCSVFQHNHPRRDKYDKWYTPEEMYPYTTYPPHCEGLAYIMTSDVVSKLHKATRRVPFYWIDDVYTTGFLAYVAGIKHTKMDPQHGYCLMKEKYSEENIKHNIFYLSKYSHQRKYWWLTWTAIQNHTSYWR